MRGKAFGVEWLGTKGARTDILFNNSGVHKVDHATSKKTGDIVGGGPSVSNISKTYIKIKETSG